MRASTLEALEKGKIKVLVSNPSDKDAENVRVTILNMGGEQVALPKSEFKFEKISAGKSVEFTVRVDGREKIESQSILLGFSVSASSGFDSSNETAEISTLMNASASAAGDKVAH